VPIPSTCGRSPAWPQDRDARQDRCTGTRSAKRASKHSPCSVTHCKIDAIFGRFSVNQGLRAPNRAHGSAPTPLPHRRFLQSKSKGWLPATARARFHTHFVVDHVTPGTYDSGSNPNWVCSGVEAAPPPRLHFRATRHEAGAFPACALLHARAGSSLRDRDTRTPANAGAPARPAL